jgi:CDP-glucose 4,6-dehydratase
VDNLLDLPNLKALNGPILITGHTGFKGTWLIELLTIHGFDVVGLALPPTKDSLYARFSGSKRYKEFFADINDLNNISQIIKEIKPVFVFHLAAQALVIEAYDKPFETFRTNIAGTLNIIEAASHSATCRGVQVITTDKVYFNTNSGKSFVEEDSLFGTDPYSGSKVGTESVVSGLQKIMNEKFGLLIQSVRAGNVIGGGDFAANRLIPDLIRSHIEGVDLVIRNPKSTRPWQHVLDPLIGYLLAAEYLLSTKEFGPFNFGPNEPSLQVSRVLELALEILPTRYLISAHEDNTRTESQTLEISPVKASKYLQWNPLFTQEHAIRLTMEWWRKVLFEEKSALLSMHEDIIFALNERKSRC